MIIWAAQCNIVPKVFGNGHSKQYREPVLSDSGQEHTAMEPRVDPFVGSAEGSLVSADGVEGGSIRNGSNIIVGLSRVCDNLQLRCTPACENVRFFGQNARRAPKRF